MPNDSKVIIDAEAMSMVRYGTMSRAVLKAVRSYFEDPKVQEEYEEWLKRQDAEMLAWISS